MKRREFIGNSAAMGIFLAAANVPFESDWQQNSKTAAPALTTAAPRKLTPPSQGPIPVAFTISEGVTVIDFCGPWEVFQDVMVEDPNKKGEMLNTFNLFTVSEKTEPLRGSAGLQLIPDYTFETAPAPKVVVIPAQRGSAALHAWLRKVYEQTDVTMSVCTGAFQLARAGLLAGKSATTHHDFFDSFARQFPNVDLKRGVRFVENDQISSAGGLTSGIDLALHVVERYFGRKTAQATADYMEYQSKGWIV